MVSRLLARRLVLVTLLLLAAASFAPLGSGRQDWLRLVFFDVGQGDAIFIETPSGRQVLIDGGRGGAVVDKLSAYLPLDDRSLDVLVLTHPHADHVGGLIPVLKRYQIDMIVVVTQSYESDTFKEFQRLVSLEGARVVNPQAGDVFDLGGGVSLKVLWPAKEASRWQENVNNLSIVLLLDYSEFEALLLADAEKEVQQQFLMSRALPSRLEVFKLAHHGSQDAFNQSLWERTKPDLSVIMVGENDYGLPSPEVLEFLRSKNARYLTTRLAGDVEVETNGEFWKVAKTGR